jgi:diguanylate cyclase (GGDEF)-like protein
MAWSVYGRWPFSFIGSRPHSPEKEQAVLRVSLGTPVLLAYGTFAALHGSFAAYITTALMAVYVAFGALSLGAVLISPSICRPRLVVATVADQGLAFAALALGGAVALPLLWSIFWFLIGSGCRYGRGTLAISAVTALSGVAGLMVWQPWWIANFSAGLGLAFSIVAVSIYLGVLVRRLELANRQLEEYATTDSLTGLKNRLWLEDAIATSLQSGGAGDGIALLLIDLDGFKAANDAYGHDVGDMLLQVFAREMARCMREGDILARLGGDEFVVLVREAEGKATVLAVASRIHAVLAGLTSVAGHAVEVSASIGVCRLPRDSQARHLGSPQIMRAADLAMYRAKTAGNGQTAFSTDADYESFAQ